MDDPMDRQNVEQFNTGEWGVYEGPDVFECEDCGHSLALHASTYGCQYEQDVWVDGGPMRSPVGGYVARPCCCKQVDPLEAALAVQYELQRVRRASKSNSVFLMDALKKEGCL